MLSGFKNEHRSNDPRKHGSFLLPILIGKAKFSLS